MKGKVKITMKNKKKKNKMMKMPSLRVRKILYNSSKRNIFMGIS